MADNILTPASGATVATDDIAGVHYPRTKLTLGADGVNDGDISEANPMPVAPQAESVAFWPGYKSSTGAAPQRHGIDPGGALVVRGAVTTDEGTFRVNFANTPLAVSLGSVTIAGSTVTGAGFLAADVHVGDYIKLDADAESAWSQIDYVNSDTTLTLTVPYVGGASGAASRALLVPVTQAGGSYSVASGQLTLNSGTTSGGGVIVGRIMDYGPLVYRSRLSISQRVANNETRIGLAEPVTVTAPRWTARFIADGTVNTLIKCETSRNPTQAPSASESEITTVTLPNGKTTAQLCDYRVEQLTENVRFYIDGVLVAEHSKVMPSQADTMVAAVRSFNPGVPATTTAVVVDYMTVKNHNKLEIGVMSDAERIVASQAPLQDFNYSVAGVIVINTVLTQIDCSQIRSLNIQCTSMGTTGVVTPEWSNNGVNWITATLIGETGATSNTFNAAVLRATNVRARYFRLRLSTATTAGTTTIFTVASQTDAAPIVATQPVSGTFWQGTQPVSGSVTATPGLPNANHINSAATTNGTVIKASAGTLYGVVASNIGAAVAFVKLHNSTTITAGTTAVALTIPVPPGAVIAVDYGPLGMRYSTGMCISITNLAADNDTTAVAAGQVKLQLAHQ